MSVDTTVLMITLTDITSACRKQDTAEYDGAVFTAYDEASRLGMDDIAEALTDLPADPRGCWTAAWEATLTIEQSFHN